jgi:hypothetical protein
VATAVGGHRLGDSLKRQTMERMVLGITTDLQH